MGIFINNAGVLDTVQDLGRTGFRKYGINPGGAMDRNSVRLINILLGNPENESVLEMHFPASQIVFERTAVFALGGAEFGARLDKKPIKNWKTYQAKAGSVLSFKRKAAGNRCYLGVARGFAIDKWLGSGSTNTAAKIGGFDGRKLANDDQIGLNLNTAPDNGFKSFEMSKNLRPALKNSETIRITRGIEYRDLTALSEQRIFEDFYRIENDSNRMGFRLDGNQLFLLSEKEQLSSAVGYGTIQLPPNGKPVILMADHQTTGGYPRIGHIVDRDLSVIGQMGAGDRIRFELVSLEDAERINEQFERDLAYLKMGVRFGKANGNN